MELAERKHHFGNSEFCRVTYSELTKVMRDALRTLRHATFIFLKAKEKIRQTCIRDGPRLL